MKRVIILFFLSICLIGKAAAQGTAGDSAYVLWLNQQIDSYVAGRNTAALDTLYAADFVFSHGSGKIEGKAGWMTTVTRANYSVRQHDSVSVELHPSLAIAKGKMFIQKINKDKTDSYHLRYIRVYTIRNERWCLVSHHTTHEWHDR
ncbi:MAG: hypothetical protein JNK14_17945 [Chitinophagaceae bacterium]|nr:hypothetical protein [Chitinophagaceae bacterium]